MLYGYIKVWILTKWLCRQNIQFPTLFAGSANDDKVPSFNQSGALEEEAAEKESHTLSRKEYEELLKEAQVYQVPSLTAVSAEEEKGGAGLSGEELRLALLARQTTHLEAIRSMVLLFLTVFIVFVVVIALVLVLVL